VKTDQRGFDKTAKDSAHD